MVVVGSPAGIGSPNVLQELKALGDTRRPLIPIICRRDDPIGGEELVPIPVAWQRYIGGLSISIEPLTRIQLGQPSGEIQNSIRNSSSNRPWTANKGCLVVDPPLTIHMQPVWSVELGRPKWPDKVNDLLKLPVGRYLACYTNSNTRPMLEVSGHVGAQ